MAKYVKKSQRFKLDGLKVRDGKKSLEVHVTSRDIAKGVPHDPCRCAFAKALMRTTGAQQARVHSSRIYLEQNGVYRRYLVTKGMTEQLELFDRTGDMGEGVYEIVPVPPSQKLQTTFEPTGKGAPRGPRRLLKRDRPAYRSA